MVKFAEARDTMKRRADSETRTVLLTGTSSGLGEAAATNFLAEGWNVVATARTAETAMPGEAGSTRLLRVRLDVTDARSIHSAFDVAETRFGAVNVVVNNAGVGLGGVFEAITAGQLRDHFEVNVIGTAAVCQAAIRRMRVRREGLIINVTSLAGQVGLPFLTPYCAGKFAVEGLTEALFYELKLFGVRVKIVEPGGIRSKFSHPWSTIEPYEPIASAANEMMKRGGGRSALPEVVARTVVAAANDPSDRLRYRATDAGTLLAIRRFLPDFAWRAFIQRVFGTRWRAEYSPRGSLL
jgi:NAD(P)-dependent dehydrogenase (short-subunit alcohol dehydrogenase family)